MGLDVRGELGVFVCVEAGVVGVVGRVFLAFDEGEEGGEREGGGEVMENEVLVREDFEGAVVGEEGEGGGENVGD